MKMKQRYVPGQGTSSGSLEEASYESREVALWSQGGSFAVHSSLDLSLELS